MLPVPNWLRANAGGPSRKVASDGRKLWGHYTVIRQKVCLNRIILLCDINLNVNERRGHAPALTPRGTRARARDPPSACTALKNDN